MEGCQCFGKGLACAAGTTEHRQEVATLEEAQSELVQRLKADPCHVTSLNLSDNCKRSFNLFADCTHRNVQLQMADATESMTALQSLNLSRNAACFVMLFWGVF